MKKLILIILMISVSSGFLTAQSGNLEVGKKVPEWTFPDASGKNFTMNEWPGKVLQVNYVDTDESDLNDSFNDAINKAVDVDKRIARESFQGFGIVDTKSTWKPKGLVRMIAGNKAKRYNTTILFDYDATLQKLWGLPKDSYSVVLVDKNRVCRAVYTGKIPESENEKIIQLIIALTKE
ncbi:MAG TPA: YtfJ family protein [Bacteroidales bacterium]|nr:YtfJ family protein [Bacteroidales bacterium]